MEPSITEVILPRSGIVAVLHATNGSAGMRDTASNAPKHPITVCEQPIATRERVYVDFRTPIQKALLPPSEGVEGELENAHWEVLTERKALNSPSRRHGASAEATRLRGAG